MREYKNWITPRPFQDDPGFIGKTFAAQIRESGLEERICDLASRRWTDLHPWLDGAGQIAKLDNSEPQYGKRNVLYRLRMPDNTLWMARLHNPLNIKPTDPDYTQRVANRLFLLESEVATMIFVKENTQIPVPGVYEYDLTYTNALGTPYIFMEYIPGKPYPFPFNDQRRIKDRDLLEIHRQLTKFAWQLAEKPFNSIGQLRFASEPGKVTVGPIIDRKDRIYGPFESSRSFYRKRAQIVYNFEKGRQEAEGSSDVSDGMDSAALHVRAAEHAGKESLDTGPFFLQHADMHWQNLLFDDECKIIGVIDWEWAQTVPLDSFNILPWNFASKMLPFDSGNVSRHQNISYGTFRALSEPECSTLKHQKAIDDMIAFQGSQRQQIARYLDDYNWPESRRKHYDHLSELIHETKSQ
ncbi:hypothetical protein N7462_003893 [Penicillium macrosclerotiorum]|uniref:uncharacterized protein n=1 Tax=Penicillium macrosclerotiorum TaxID=303699 RepID=UPI002547CC8A|nr:uncharacterized protein N7462_003893 [Penicillium macrosclerotiorum]KAJ5689501.1 hypothetical protein N7462_003893 [Penicillium macrosclerotiorum]